MNYAGLSTYDTANGTGIRVSLFVSGCRVHCKDCFSKETWNFDYGRPFTEETKNQILHALNNPYIAGFSLLGGDPFEPEHATVLTDLLHTIKERFPEKTVWAWTGRRYENVKNSPLMPFIDVLVDGPYVAALRVKHQFYGSQNQRIIPIVNGVAEKI